MSHRPPADLSGRPDPMTARSPAEFVGAMRQLKHWCGMGYRQLARRALAVGDILPRSTITAALTRSTLPREDLVAVFARTCGCTKEEVERWVAARRRIAAAGSLPHRPSAIEQLPAPAQLPPPVAGFVGRTWELNELHTLLAQAAEAPVISITGTAGVGKTALAIHWACQVADRFPDGQLYVDLGGFASRRPTSAADAARRFLDAFGVPPHRIPDSPQAQADLYRTMLAGRRILVLLDNAYDSDHVRPLLPAARGCLAIVTSRSRLTGLAIAHGARHVPLDLLSTADAEALLTRRLGSHRVTAEPRAAEEIITLCGRLPLALAIVAARGTEHPWFSLEVLAGELRDTSGRLGAFDGEDQATDLRAVFSWSYRQLSAGTARLFRLIGRHPGPDFTTAAAASLTGASTRNTTPMLSELSRTHLVTEHTPGRFTCHDLLHGYANELAHAVDPVSERRAALHRLLDHYLHTAHAADRLLNPHRDPIPLHPACLGVAALSLTEPSQAIAWFDAEYRVLLAVGQLAADEGFATHAWQLAWSLTTFSRRRGLWRDQAATQETALGALRRADDRTGRAHAHRGLAYALTRLGRCDEAERQYADALELFEALDDTVGMASTHLETALMHERTDRYRSALWHARRSHALFRVAADVVGEGRALNALGWYWARLGEPRRALSLCERSLALLRDRDGAAGQADTWCGLGYVHHLLGDHSRAVDCYRQALELLRSVGHRYNEARTLGHLGDAHHAAGNLTAAAASWRQALDILDELDCHGAERTRAKLDDLSRSDPADE